MRGFFLPLIICISTASAQSLTPALLTSLNTSLNETSGLLLLQGHLWTLLDSGNPAALYEVDPASGEVLRTVAISNASNVDWEDITTDGTWIYIGDIGNNQGSRTDLRVYRFPTAELLDTSVVSVEVDTIAYAYVDQVDFAPASNATNWDCEAMIAADDSLFLFTKNWENNKSYLYAMPAAPGVHLALRKDSLDTQGLVTGASYDAAHGSLLLCGYTELLAPFLWQLWGFPGHGFFQGQAMRHEIQLPFGQVEGIAWTDAGNAYLSNEQNPFSIARLWEVGLVDPMGLPPMHHSAPPLVVFDQGADLLTIRTTQTDTLRIADEHGAWVLERILQVGNNRVSTAALGPGLYIVDTGPNGTPVRIVVVR